MTDTETLCTKIKTRFADWIDQAVIAYAEVTVEVKPAHLLELCRALHDEPDFAFNLLADVCGIDYPCITVLMTGKPNPPPKPDSAAV